MHGLLNWPMKACPENANACPTQGWRAENLPSFTEQNQ